MLRAWGDAPLFLLSCPGPLRRHHAALQPISQLSLPQCLLGGEAQLLTFAAAFPELAARSWFVPLPEMFGNAHSMAHLRQVTGLAPSDGRAAHFRFGGTRSARVLKEGRNGLVLAEQHRVPAVTASRHPYADGLTVPAAFRRLFTCGPVAALPVSFGGAALPATELAADMVAADLAETPAAEDGLEIVSLAEFRSNAFAAGPVRGGSADLRAAVKAARRDQAPFVLVPWNLDHPGSTVPALVERTLHLQSPAHPAVRLLLLPFNYPGQTGLIRRLIRLVRDYVPFGPEHLPQTFVGRVSHLGALPALRGLARAAWVDGNDPEHDWTARRLAACGFAPLLLAADTAPPPEGVARIPADEALTVDAETRFGLLSFHTHLPSLRALRQLLPLTRALGSDEAPKRPRRRATPAARAAQ